MFYLFYFNPILIAAAVIPAVILLIKVYRADRLDKEPPGLLISLVLFGIFATGLAMATERLGEGLLARLFETDSAAYRAVLYFVVVALSEEGFKYLLLRVRTWRSPAFNCQFDGVVYAVFVSLGFALWENIGYVTKYGFSTALIRAVTAVPGHACFGVFMGIWYGLAKRYDSVGCRGISRTCRIMAVLLPMLLHGCYDFIASVEADGSTWFFVGFIGAMFALALILVQQMSHHDRYINNTEFYV